MYTCINAINFVNCYTRSSFAEIEVHMELVILHYICSF